MPKKSIRAIAATAMMALMLSVGGGVAAFAEVSGSDSVSTPAIDNINKRETGSLTVHKKLNPQKIGPKASGKVMDSVSGTDLDGVSFTVKKLEYDVATIAGFEAASQYAKSFKTSVGAKFDPSFEEQTAVTGKLGQKGEAKFQELPIGLYLVKEDASKAEAPDGQSVQNGPDFLVFVPMVDESGKSWNYDVHVYPKNSSEGITKKVNDRDKNVADEISYTLEAVVPALPAVEGVARTDFTITDTFSKGKLSGVTIESVMTGDQTLKYTTTPDDVSTSTESFTVRVKDPNKLVAGQTVVVKVKAKVKPIGEAGNGAIVNKASYDREDTTNTDYAPVPSKKVVTYFGKLNVKKTGISGQPLAGAEFKIFKCARGGEGFVLGEPIVINKQEVWVTNENGEFAVDGLHVNDYADNLPVEASDYFCVQEIKAPAGYIKPTGQKAIKEFQLLVKERNTVLDPNNESYQETKLTLAKADLTIENEPSNTPDLPLTGGQGIALLVVLGAGVAGLAVYSARRNSTKA